MLKCVILLCFRNHLGDKALKFQSDLIFFNILQQNQNTIFGFQCFLSMLCLPWPISLNFLRQWSQNATSVPMPVLKQSHTLPSHISEARACGEEDLVIEGRAAPRIRRGEGLSLLRKHLNLSNEKGNKRRCSWWPQGHTHSASGLLTTTHTHTLGRRRQTN